MAKVLRCSDLMPGCSCKAVVEGKDLAEVMAKAEEHAKTAHGMMTIPPEIAAKVRAAIKDSRRAVAHRCPADRDVSTRSA